MGLVSKRIEGSSNFDKKLKILLLFPIGSQYVIAHYYTVFIPQYP